MVRAILALAVAMGCSKSDAPAPAPSPVTPPRPASPSLPGVDLPEVAGPGYVAAELDLQRITANRRTIAVDGLQLMPLTDGVPPPDEIEGGALGIKIPKVSRVLHDHPPRGRIGIAIDGGNTYGLLIKLLFSAKVPEAGAKQFAIYARTATALVMVPIDLPTKRPAVAMVGEGGAATGDMTKRRPGATLGEQIDAVKREAPTVTLGGRGKPARRGDPVVLRPVAPDGTPEPVPPVMLFVSVTRERLLLWSIDGSEGTLQQPKLEVRTGDPAGLAKLGDALADILARRWTASAETQPRQIIVQAESAMPMQIVAGVFGAVRATAAGKPLFPDVLLSSGFE